MFSLGMTFTNMRLAQQEPVRFIGLENWTRLFSDQRFITTLGNTLIFAITSVTVQYALGLLLAVLLNQKIRARWFFRMSFLLPLMMSPVAVSFMIGKLMLSESRGPFAALLMSLDLPPMRWSTAPFGSMAVLIAVDTWQWTPFFILVLLAGLQSVDAEIQEAAKVDGANAWQTFWRITFPMLLPLSTIAILIRSLEAFKVVDIIRVVTGGGPGNSTESVTLYAYTMGMNNGDLAYATTMAYVLLIATILYATAFLFISRRLTRWRDA
ncbi:MAG: sugar ABC transporter permease [Chloroflexi bacterium]|nr:sugar ABC transporter permease [Chloroflexota bacterium]